jgi:hypothetical protein
LGSPVIAAARDESDKHVASRRLAASPDGPTLVSLVAGRVGPDMPNTPNTTSHHTPESSCPKPTAAQLNYLRTLAAQTGTGFAWPPTKAAASREIARLKTLSGRTDHSLESRNARRERRTISVELAERNHDAVAVHDDEIAGYGSSAHWA